MKKRIISTLLLSILMTTMTTPVFALTDTAILLDPVQNTYEGTANGQAHITNVNFRDVPANHWAKEAITRMGAMGVIRGDGAGGTFRPNGTVSNEEALAFIMRLIGREQQSLDEGVRLKEQYTEGANARELWSLGYLSVASTLGFIDANDLADATTPDQSMLDAQNAFLRQRPATREQVAEWVSMALRNINQEGYTLPTEYVRIKNFTDWAQVDPEKIQHIEAILNSNIMAGVSATSFQPKGSVTRAQMAQILKNTDKTYYDIEGFEKKNGTVAAITDEREAQTGASSVTRRFHIRTADGRADVISLLLNQNTMGAFLKDAVVFNAGTVAGLNSLKEGDEIEYIVTTEAANENTPKEIHYVHMRSGVVETKTSGLLYQVDTATNQISVKDEQGRISVYTLAQGLLTEDNGQFFLAVDGIYNQNTAALPYGSEFELTLLNNIVKLVFYKGDPVLKNEIGGVVLENDPQLGSITLYAHNGTVVSKQYFEEDLTIRKLEYYTKADEIGYISQMFPFFRYDPNATGISSIEAGDVVFLALDDNDPNIVTAVSASTNYVMRYGRILQIDPSRAPAGVTSVLLEAENKQTGWYDLADGIGFTKEGRPANANTLQPGDWIRILVNQAIVEPGHYIESVKAVGIEGEARYITGVVKGQLGSVDEVQKRVSILNVQELTQMGWVNHQELERYDISGRDTEIYMDGQKISFDYALEFLKRGGAEAYVALENNFGADRVRKITFRTGRDDVLSPDLIVRTTGSGNFLLANMTNDINSDAGTIVVRGGRLVDANVLSPPDYANVVINGANRAAVVSVSDAPGVSAPIVLRGRIQSVDEGKSFTVSSFAMLAGSSWSTTPVQRTFTIDYNTKFYTAGGFADINTIVGFGANSSIDTVYTVITDGSRADWILDQPYPQRSIKGTVYETAAGSLALRNVLVYNANRGSWTTLSQAITVNVTTPVNGAIIKSNKIADISNVEVGDVITVMTDTLPQTVTAGTNVTGYVVFVEN